MRELLEAGKAHLKKMDFVDLSLFKGCLLALGVLVGLDVSERRKKSAKGLARLVFFLTFLPLMGKFLDTLSEITQKRQEGAHAPAEGEREAEID